MADIFWIHFVGICLVGSFYFMARSYRESRQIEKEHHLADAIERIERRQNKA